MRISIEKATKKIIEMQTGGSTPEHLDTLKQNATNAGYLEEDIEVKFVTDAEYAIAKSEDPNEITRIAEQAAKEAEQLAKAQAYIDNIPSWIAVKGAIDAAFIDAKQNGIITKLARVVYWDIKNTEL
jgi:predicted RNA-binding Zn ribbon-like protein